mgnify:CR=1 FL=1
MDGDNALDRRVIIVTGAGGGIGSATSKLLAAKGVNVVAVDVVVEHIPSSPLAENGTGTIVPLRADLGDTNEVQAAIHFVMERWGRIDGVFNNAAIEGPIVSIGSYSETEFDRVFRTNLKGVWLVMKHAIPALQANGGGSIVNTASTAGLMGWPNMSGYVASKHAVIGLTRAAAMECTAHGIRVNAICPGPTDTRMIWSIGEATAPGDPEKARRLQEVNVPLARLAQPDEIGRLAAWLLLESPPYLTGAVIPIDGGQTSGYGAGRTM